MALTGSCEVIFFALKLWIAIVKFFFPMNTNCSVSYQQLLHCQMELTKTNGNQSECNFVSFAIFDSFFMKHSSMLQTSLLLTYVLSYQSTKNFLDLFLQFLKN